jgi:hypothetical protein
MQKVKFVWAVLQLLWSIGDVARKTRDLYEIYVDRGYASGTNAITDADLQVSSGAINLNGLTVTQFNEASGVLVDLINFMDGKTVALKDQLAIINKYRQDI